MGAEAASDLVREALMVALTIGAPLLLVGMVAGLLIGLFQALTQIQDQTVAFVPKILAIALVMIACMPWLIQRMVEFTQHLILSASNIGP